MTRPTGAQADPLTPAPAGAHPEARSSAPPAAPPPSGGHPSSHPEQPDVVTAMTARVREAFPDAQAVQLSSSDQNLYGYDLDAVLCGPARHPVQEGEAFEELREEVDEGLGGLDWGAFGDREEDSTFYVRLDSARIKRE